MPSPREDLRDCLFDEALALPVEDRAGYLRANCADEELAREIESLLAFASGTAGALSTPIRSVSAWADAAPGEQPDRIGPYRVVRLIGQGGMGTVYQCVRDDDQFRKQVAIKLVHGWARSEQGLRRFRQERQILADLAHPHIASLLDGGTTGEGLPFLVMEYVEGEALTAYCVGHGLETRARLALFQKVCVAVHYAHQHLVIHRDLKPSNILVTPAGEPKLLDFGIAKLLDQETREEASAPETRTGMVMMTPEYASPEQVRGESVSAGSDVYSLGAVLYEVLTGHRPHQFKRYDPGEVARQVCQSEIKPPSEWGVAGLRGDLSTVVLKAMEKDPARRYNSAAQFGEDLQRYLMGLPIVARPDTLAYRTGKFIRRNRVAVGATFAVVLTLGGVAAVAVIQARVARERFDEVRILANRFLFDFHDAIAGIEGTTKAREMIVSTALEYLDRLGGSAGRDRGLKLELAAAYMKVARVQGFPGEPNLGRIDDARKSLDKALGLYEEAGIVGAAELERKFECLERLAYLESDQENYGKSLYWWNRALSLAGSIPLERMTPGLASSFALARAHMADAFEGEGNTEAAYRTVKEAESTLRNYAAINPTSHFDTRPDSLLLSVNTVARLSGRLEEALAASSELLQKKGFTPGARGAFAARASEVYCSVDDPSWDDPAKALPLVLESVQSFEARLRADPNDVNMKHALATNNSKIGYYLRQSDPPRAVRALAYSIGLFETLAREDPGNKEYPDRLVRYGARMALARSYRGERRAVEELSAHALAETRMGAGQKRLHVLNLCGLALANVGDRAKAAAVFEEGIGIASRLVSSQGHRMTTLVEATRTYEEYAEFLRESGDREAARRFLGMSAHVWQTMEPATTYVRLRRARGERLLASLREKKLWGQNAVR